MTPRKILGWRELIVKRRVLIKKRLIAQRRLSVSKTVIGQIGELYAMHLAQAIEDPPERR
ncbi:MAG: hypothetical protein QOH96_1246 [Blastocatellia bacterium]|jgi:hypothetical protein|nr:hypothetical protein [Blastocatellia bacterium]